MIYILGTLLFCVFSFVVSQVYHYYSRKEEKIVYYNIEVIKEEIYNISARIQVLIDEMKKRNS